MRYFKMHIKYIDGNTASGIQSVASERSHGAAVATLKPFNAQQIKLWFFWHVALLLTKFWKTKRGESD